jgi:peptidoglycan/xylan/chitin deacetylase (PgdA/CDA1 family)
MRKPPVVGLLVALGLVVACSRDDAPVPPPPLVSCEQGEDACATYTCNVPKPKEAASDGGSRTTGASERTAFGAPAPAHPPVYVSLTFDDTFDDQYQLLEMMRPFGMHVTLYVNSARIGQPTYLNEAQLKELAAAGHEIAGHTVTHPTLPAVDEDEQRRQICNDRLALLQRGFDVRNFAYPHGAFTALTQHVVDDCGYNSARIVGGLGCSGCPVGETAGPEDLARADRYALRTPTSIKCNTDLQDIQRQVIAAEADRGGWVPIVFHHVCDGCGQNAVAPDVLREFVTWLAARKDGGTVVRTVAEMVGGDLRPGKAGPPPAPQVARSGNIIDNGGFEEGAPETPDVARCWVKGGEGDNDFDYGRTNEAHTGQWAQWLEVKRITSGARRIATRQDLGYCSPVILPGRVYHLSAWYKSTAKPRFTVYYRDPTGFWQYWATSKPLPTSADWTQQALDLPKTPDDASAISVSLSLTEPGRIVMDDIALEEKTQ